MGIASGAFIGPSATRAMSEVQVANLPHTQGLVGELQHGSVSAELVLLLLLAGAALAIRWWIARRSHAMPRS